MATRRRRATTATSFVALLGLGAVACSTPADPEIVVTTSPGPFAPLGVELTGLEPGTRVVLEAEAVVDDARFRSAATFDVPTDGALDLADDAPRSGDWSVADPMAPIWSMSTGGHWDPATWDGPFEVDLTVSSPAGETLATTTVPRPGAGPHVTVRDVDDGGLVAEYVVPVDLPAGEQRPALLVFGGSEGGLTSGASTARWLAGLGYPALGISYFGSPGQPAELAEIPVETFLDALAWLHDQPEVNGSAVLTFGVSRGGEMALWLAAEHPELVHGAVAPVGAGVLVCGYPDESLPAWTLADEPLTERCLRTTDRVPPREALVDVASIAGPVVLACGTRDTIWPSCDLADDVAERRAQAPGAVTVQVDGTGADHFVAWAPYVPLFDPATVDVPSTRPATHEARRELWDHLARLLGELRGAD